MTRATAMTWVDTWEAFKLAVRDRHPTLYFDTERTRTLYDDAVDVTAGRSSPWPARNYGVQRHSL